MRGIEKLWIIGDNFVATSYQNHFKKAVETDFFMKSRFEISSFCSSKFSDKNTNPLSRLQICVATAISNKTNLPHYMLLVIDDDLIKYLQFKGPRAPAMYGPWIEWLAKSINDLVQTRLSQLAPKAVVWTGLQIYWVALPSHRGFDAKESEARTKFSLCLESVAKLYSNMRVIKLKD